ncbi:MAG: PP2C family protein-serine/threonine phosphatase [Vicinamibacterales bacterium]
MRTRLIIAFLALSVLPLTAVTLYSYSSSVNAFRAAVANESERMAADLEQRLDTVTADLGRQMGRLWEPGVAGANAEPVTASSLPVDVRVIDQVARLLGDSAMLLERVELTPARVPVPPGPPAPPPSTIPPGAPPASTPPAGIARSAPPSLPAPIVLDLHEAMAAVEKDLTAEGVSPEMAARLRQWGETLGPALQAGLKIAGSATRTAAAAISEKARQRALERAARARELAAADRRAAFEGDALSVPIVRDGQLVGSVNAQLNLPRTFATVLGSTQTSQGEIPFAIDADGVVHTSSPEQERELAALKVASLRGSAVTQTGDWVVVTRQASSNITFGIARPVAGSLQEIRNASMRSLLLGLAVIGLALLGIVPLSRHMTRNLTTLTDGVQRIARGEFATQVPVRSRDEFGALAAAFNDMARDVAHHQQLVVERERLQRELELCRRIQSEMLPHASLRLGPTEVKGISIPAREVGGDFFNYFELPGGHIAVLVGDVSGKGISAALLMANIQATLRARLPLEPDLARLASAIDGEIEAATPAGVYATLFLGILDPERKTLRYVNAGHHPQFLIRGDGIEALSSSGMPVGLYAGQGYVERAVQLADNDLLFFYTDGTVEVENEQTEMFGAERLESLLRTHRDQGVDGLLERIEESVRRFRGAADPFDDVTIMALRLGTQPAAAAAGSPAA